MGVELVGRLATVRDGRALFSGGLRNVISLSDLKMERLLGTFDEWATAPGRTPAPARPSASSPPGCRAVTAPLDLGRGEIQTIVWATGFRPDYRWLDVPVADAKGQPAARKAGW